MKAYEVMVILRADFPLDDEKKIHDLLTKITGGATIKDVSVLGKKRLAYPIKKIGVAGAQNEGVYVLSTLEADGLTIGAVEREVHMGTDVLRYLITAKKEGK